MTTAWIIAALALALTFLVQFAAIVWFASSLRAAVNQLIRTTNKLEETAESWERWQSKLDRRVAVLEDRQARERA